MQKLVKKTPQIVRDMIKDRSQFLHFTKNYSWTGLYNSDFYIVRQNNKIVKKISLERLKSEKEKQTKNI